MKILLSVILKLIASTAGLLAVAALGYGVFGVILALFSRGGGFVGEESFYASALFFLSLFMIAAGASARFISYLCWVRLKRSRT